jgi:hypothetical protein
MAEMDLMKRIRIFVWRFFNDAGGFFVKFVHRDKERLQLIDICWYLFNKAARSPLTICPVCSPVDGAGG